VNRNHLIANAILWAAAILASALVGAPSVLSALLLPTLAIASLLFMGPRLRKCGAVR
jgi:hypothetical protein